MMLNAALVLFACAQLVLSDTEIVNFSSKLHSTDPSHFIPPDWPVISKQNNSRTLSLIPTRRGFDDGNCTTLQGSERKCIDQERDVWIVLDLDSWLPAGEDAAIRQSFTLRLSSPASTPSDFRILFMPTVFHPKRVNTNKMTHPPTPPRAKGVLYDLDQRRALDSEQDERVSSHRMFVQIRGSTARFVRSPNADGAVFPFQFTLLPEWVLPAPLPTLSASDPWMEEVAFNVILEPLIIGALPESTLPGVIFLVVILLLVGLFGLPLANAELSKLANRARKGKGKVE